MALQLDQTILADHPRVREALERHGFQKTNASGFSNGRATVRFEGPMMIAVPGDGSRTWQSNVASAPPEVVVGLLDTVLPIPSFLSQAELDRRVERAHAAKMALDRIVDVIRESPETHGGPELRRFLWSLFNGHHVLNLWRLRDELDFQRGFRSMLAVNRLAGDRIPRAFSDREPQVRARRRPISVRQVAHCKLL